MKLRVRRRTARVALWTGVAGGPPIAAAAAYVTQSIRPLEALIALAGPWPPVLFVGLCLLCAAARMTLRRSPVLTGPILGLGLARYVVNIAFPVAGIILLPIWLIAAVAGALLAPYLLQALLLTAIAFVMTTLSVGLAINLALLLGPKPDELAG